MLRRPALSPSMAGGAGAGGGRSGDRYDEDRRPKRELLHRDYEKDVHYLRTASGSVKIRWIDEPFSRSLQY